MIYTAEARRQIADLRDHYERSNRPEALRNLQEALLQAEAVIETRPETGLPSPRPYPSLARPGRHWTKAGRYWIAFTPGPPPVILAVFYDAADIPGRL